MTQTLGRLTSSDVAFGAKGSPATKALFFDYVGVPLGLGSRCPSLMAGDLCRVRAVSPAR
jgi:hypothetical protein